MILIGLAGKPGSGRDRVAKHLVVKHGFAQYRMIAPVREMLAHGLFIERDQFDDAHKRHQQFAIKMPTPAVLEESLKQWGESVNQDIWIAIAAGIINAMAADNPDLPGLVISDIPGDREADWIRRYGGSIWHTGDVTLPVGNDVAHYVDDDPSILLGPNDDPGALVDSLLRDLYVPNVVIPATSVDSINAGAKEQA